MFSSAMKINERNVISFAASDSTVDKEGYLLKKTDVKRRWFVLKGNLLFYYEKKQDREPAGLIVLESYSVQASATEKHGFEISFDGPGTRTYVLVADNDEEMQSWMRCVSHASYEFLRGIVNELQKQVNSLTSHTKSSSSNTTIHSKPPRRDGDGKIPLVPKPKQRVENGVLVDVVGTDLAPPVPPKRRLVVVKTPSPEPSAQKGSSHLSPTSPVPYHPTPPHTNPVVVQSTGKTLSPPSTMDRTPILTPMVLATDGDTDTDYDVPPPPVPAKSERSDESSVEYLIDTVPTTHSPAIGSAGTDWSQKDTYEIHKELSEAVKGLSTTDDRTGTDNVVT